MKKYASRALHLSSAVIILVLASGLLFIYQAYARKVPLRQYLPSENVGAVWEWRDPRMYRSSDQLDRLSNFLYLHQIDTVFLDVSQTADFANSNTYSDLSKSICSYTAAMAKRSISVYAAAGNVEWSKPQERNKPLSVFDFVVSHNQQCKNRLAGIEYDIESYNQEGFPEASATEKEIVLSELLDTVEALSIKAQQHRAESSQDFAIGFAIPYWFDNQNGNIPSVTWRDKTGPTLYHIVDQLQMTGGGNIVVMAYRNAATGSDGTIFHSRTEVEYAATKAPAVKVLIGQEVTNVEPEKITFYGHNPAELSNETRAIADEFRPFSSFGGFAINDLEGLQMLDTNR